MKRYYQIGYYGEPLRLKGFAALWAKFMLWRKSL